jgi:hypothetical protein
MAKPDSTLLYEEMVMMRAGLNLVSLAVLLSCSMLSFSPAFADVAGSSVTFSYAQERLNLSYPAGWAVQQDGDKSTILKVASPESSPLRMTFIVNEMSGIDDEYLALSLLEQVMRTQLSSYKVVKSGS